MKAEYLPGFVKDLKALRGAAAGGRIHKLVFEDVERWADRDEVAGLKSCAATATPVAFGSETTARDFFPDGSKITFARVLHRKEIYRFFP